jgi:hypothetical protein
VPQDLPSLIDRSTRIRAYSLLVDPLRFMHAYTSPVVIV